MKNSFGQRQQNLKVFESVRKKIRANWADKQALDLQERQMQARVRSLEKDILQLDCNFDAQLRDLNEQITTERADLAETLKETRKEKANLVEQLEAITAENKGLLEANQDKEKALTGLFEELSKVSHQRLAEHTKNAKIENERSALEEKIEEGEAEIEQLNKRNEEFNVDVLEVEERVEGLSRKTREMVKAKETERKREIKMRNDLANRQKEHVNAAGILESLEAQIREIENKVANKKRELEGHQAKLVRQRRRTEVLERMLKAKELTVRQMELALGDLLEEERASRTHLVHEEELLTKKEVTQAVENKKIQKLEEMLRRKRDGFHRESDQLLRLERMVKKLDNQIGAVHAEIRRLGIESEKVKAQQEKYAHMASVGHTRFYEKVEEAKLKNFVVADLQRMNGELATDLRNEQTAYESVRKECNAHGKQLLELKEDILWYANRHKNLVHQIKQLSEEVCSKNYLSINQSKKAKRIGTENADLDNRLLGLENKTAFLEQSIKYNESEIDKLKVMLKEAEEQKKAKLKEQTLIMNERDILGRQIIRRKQDMNGALKEIKVLGYYIRNSENHFHREAAVIEHMSARLARIRDDLERRRAERQGLEIIEAEVDKLSKECIALKNRNALLREETRHVVNVHEWRQVQATQGELYDLILKVQGLQKKNIAEQETLEQHVLRYSQRAALCRDLRRQLKDGVHDQRAKELKKLDSALGQKKKDFGQVLDNLETAKHQLESLEQNVLTLDTEIEMHKKNYIAYRSGKVKAGSFNYSQSMLSGLYTTF